MNANAARGHHVSESRSECIPLSSGPSPSWCWLSLDSSDPWGGGGGGGYGVPRVDRAEVKGHMQ